MAIFRVRIFFDRLAPKPGFPDYGWCDYDQEAATFDAAMKIQIDTFKRQFSETHRITKYGRPGDRNPVPEPAKTPDLFDQ